MKVNPALIRKDIRVEFVEKDFSRYGVFPVVASFLLDVLGLDNAFDRVLKMEKKRFSFSASDYLLTLFTSIFLGISRFYHIDDLFCSETTIASLLGIRSGRFPSGRSLYRLLDRVSYYDWYRLGKVRFEVTKRYRDWLSQKRWLVIDIDQTNKLTEGRKIQKATPCFDRKRKGKLGLRLSTSQVEGLVFAQRLESGNTSGFTNFERLYQETEKQLSKLSSPLKLKRVKDKKQILRIDGGYFSQEVLEFLDERVTKGRFEFVVRAKANLKLIKQAKLKVKPGLWQQVDDKTKVLRLSNQQILPNHNTKYTVLIIRQDQTRIRSKKKRVTQTTQTLEYVLVTSIKNWNSKRLIKFYKKRQQVENIFRDYNQSFSASKLPSHSFWGNAFYFEMVSLVHNVTFFLSRHTLLPPTKQRQCQAFAVSLSSCPAN